MTPGIHWPPNAHTYEAVRAAHPALRVEVEVTDLDQLRELLDAGCREILLDNMSTETMAEAVRLVDERGADGRATLEASGGLTTVLAIGFIALIALVNLRGVAESVYANVVLTLVELSGLLLVIMVGVACQYLAADEFLRLSVNEYRDKMQGGWIGQIAGVSWGAPTEFKWRDQIIPADQMPKWRPAMINDAFGQDDLYVEMTFLRTLEQYGLDASIRQAGIDFANSGYPLWCANNAGRTNLRQGIAPPDSSHNRRHDAAWRLTSAMERRH